MDPNEVLLGVTRVQRNAALDAAAASHASDVLGYQARITELEAQVAHLLERLNPPEAEPEPKFRMFDVTDGREKNAQHWGTPDVAADGA